MGLNKARGSLGRRRGVAPGEPEDQRTDACGHAAATCGARPTTGPRRAQGLPGLAVVTLLGLLTGCASHPPAAEPRSYSFWPPAPNKPRVQFLVAFESSAGIAPPESTLKRLAFGREPRPELVIRKPYGVAMWHGCIYVCDTRGGALVVIDLARSEMRVIGTSGANRLVKPTAIAVAPDGTKYVAESARGVIVVYGPDDRQIGILGHTGLKPASLAVRGDELYVADFATHHIEVVDRTTGQTRRLIGSAGHEPGQLFGPLGLDLDPQGNLYVADFACRLQKLGPDGTPLWETGSVGRTPGTFTRPKQLAVDGQGHVYVVDAAFQNVQVFDGEGKALMDFGGGGGLNGSMELPAGICVYEGDVGPFQQYVHPAFAAERLLVVTNQIGPNKVAVYACGHEREGMSVGAYTTPATMTTATTTVPATAAPTTATPGTPADDRPR